MNNHRHSNFYLGCKPYNAFWSWTATTMRCTDSDFDMKQ